MEQTLVDQFYQVKKRNDFHPNPTKRRKLSEDSLTGMHSLKRKEKSLSIRGQKAGKRQVGRAAQSATRKSEAISIKALLSTNPLSQTTSCIDDHNNTERRKVSNSHKSEPQNQEERNSLSETAGVAETNVTSTETKQTGNRSIKVDPWIAAQSKIILKQRNLEVQGAIPFEGTRKYCNRKPEDLNQLHGQKESDVQTTVQNKSNECLGNRDSNEDGKKKTRSSLRKKYAHLLAKPSSTPDKADAVREKPNIMTTNPEFSEKVTPAYKRLKTLAVAHPVPFALPHKFTYLLEQFKCVDSILFLLEQRSETCTFEKLKKAVESMSGRNFEKKHLAKCKTVFPDAFIFRQEKDLYKVNGSKCSEYQLTIEPHFLSDLMAKRRKHGKDKLSPTVLVTRRAVFESNLIKIVQGHHQKFLLEDNIHLSEHEVKRWHPKFDLEKVPDIKEANLPKPPSTNTITSAKDILCNTTKKQIPQVSTAAERVASTKKETPVNTTSGINSSALIKKDTPNKLMNGVSQSLLERIRQKEQKKNELAMTRDPQKEKELAMMERLPDISRIMKTYFITEKKCAMPVEDCIQKLSESYGSAISLTSLDEHLTLLAKLVPTWIKIVAVRNCPYIKIVKGMDMNKIQQELATKRKEAVGS